MNWRERIVQNIKDCGQSLIDNAENIVNNYKYVKDITITCYVGERDEALILMLILNFIQKNRLKDLCYNFNT